MTLNKELYLGQGVLDVCERALVSGVAKPSQCFTGLEVSSVSISPSETIVTHMEHKTGKMQTDGSATFRPEISISIVFDNLHPDALAFFYKGTATQIAAGSVTGEAHTLGADKVLYTEKSNIDPSTVVVTETAPGAGAIAASSLSISQSGRIVIDPSEAATAVTVDYDHNATDQMSAYTGDNNQTYYLIYDGININDDEKLVKADFYKVKFNLEGEQSLIGEDYATVSMTGTVLLDESQPDDPVNGQYFKYQTFAKT